MPRAGAPSLTVPSLEDRLARWFDLWGVPELASEVSVEFSSRMTRSLGLCYPKRSLIRLAERLRRRPTALLEEVLCHEAAHLASYRLHGRKTRPHGREWRSLVERAGYAPATRFAGDSEAPPGRRRRTARYEHRCPVCQAARVAGRPMRRWRCAACVDAGLDGRLEIRSLPRGREGGR